MVQFWCNVCCAANYGGATQLWLPSGHFSMTQFPRLPSTSHRNCSRIKHNSKLQVQAQVKPTQECSQCTKEKCVIRGEHTSSLKLDQTCEILPKEILDCAHYTLEPCELCSAQAHYKVRSGSVDIETTGELIYIHLLLFSSLPSLAMTPHLMIVITIFSNLIIIISLSFWSSFNQLRESEAVNMCFLALPKIFLIQK